MKSAPSLALPADAWDSHAHVFGPFDGYPLLTERRYDPPLAPAEDYLSALDDVGFARGVLVHPSACGYDNSCTRDALRKARGRFVGVGVVQPSISDRELEQMHADGFCAVRVTVTGARSQQYSGSLDYEGLRELAPRLQALGWHVEVWSNCERIVAAAPELASYGMPVVFDHMGYFNPDAGIDDAVFQSFLRLLKSNDFWVKMIPIRLSKTAGPDYAGIRPFHDCLLAAVPDRALYGTDWPHLSMEPAPMRVARLINLFDSWTKDHGLRQRIFVDNPRRLYGRDDATGSG
jgi:2-pyrone-4,6-dicarboxylate lactonase